MIAVSHQESLQGFVGTTFLQIWLSKRLKRAQRYPKGKYPGEPCDPYCHFNHRLGTVDFISALVGCELGLWFPKIRGDIRRSAPHPCIRVMDQYRGLRENPALSIPSRSTRLASFSM